VNLPPAACRLPPNGKLTDDEERAKDDRIARFG